MSKLTIEKGETGMVRVFAVNRPIPDMSRAIKSKGKAAVASDLLGLELAEAGVELFPVSDLTGVGLPAYLVEGHAIPAEDIARDRARLDALDGHVLVLRSTAFQDRAAEIDTGSDLTLIGSYGETRADMTAAPIPSEAARPYTGTPQAVPVTPPKGRAGSAIAVVAVAVCLLLLIWWLLA